MSRNGRLRFIAQARRSSFVKRISQTKLRHALFLSCVSRSPLGEAEGLVSSAKRASRDTLHEERASGEKAPRRRLALVYLERRAHRREKSVESFTTSRHLNIIRQFCKHGLMTAVVFDMVCTSRQAGWYEGDSCFPVSREIVWDGLPYWYYGIGILAGDHSLPQWIPMAPCAGYGGLCVAGVA